MISILIKKKKKKKNKKKNNKNKNNNEPLKILRINFVAERIGESK